jgi:PBP1b-binding outer membrane lipoprotein LpoB
MIAYRRLLQDADNSRNNEVMMKNLLAIVFIATLLYACGGGFTPQDKVSVEKAHPTKQRTLEHTTVEENKLPAGTDQETAEQTATESKSDSAIKMMQGLARSMF